MKSFDEILKERKNGEQSQNRQATSNRSFDSIMAERKKSELLSNVESLTKNKSSFVDEYNARYFDAEGKPIQQYRSDSGEWLNKVNKNQSTISSQERNIRYMLSQYGKYYDEDFLKGVNSVLDSEADADVFKQIVDRSVSDHKYYSQWATEEDYNFYIKNNEDMHKYSEMSLEDLKEIQTYQNNLKEERKKLQTEITSLTSNVRRSSGNDPLWKEVKKKQARIAEIDKELGKTTGKQDTIKPFYGKGNIDLNNRPVVKNEDGTISTVRGMSINEDGKEILIPTIVNGKIVSDEEAIEHYHKTGEYLGKFDTVEEANAYAEQLHLDQEEFYKDKPADNSGVLYYDSKGRAVTLDSLITDKEHEATFNAIKNNPAHQEAYNKALKAQANIEKLDKDYQNIQSQLTAYSRTGAVPDYLMTEMNNIASAIEKQKAVINEFDALGYNFEELRHYNRMVTSRDMDYQNSQESQKYAEEHPIKATLNSLTSTPEMLLEYAGNLADVAQYGYANIYDDTSINKSQVYQSTVANLINDAVVNKTDSELAGWLASTAYSGITSASQSAVIGTVGTILSGGNAAVGSAMALSIMGTQAASSSFNSAVRNGSTSGEAIAFSFASGIGEALFEKLPLDNLFNIVKGVGKSITKESLVELIKGVAKQSVIEGLEEGGTELWNFMADEIINGDHSAYNIAVDKYLKQGYSETDARELASRDWLGELITSMVGGFIGGASSGSVVGVPSLAIHKANENKYYNQAGKDIIANAGVQTLADNAKEIPALRELAEQVEGVKTEDLSKRGNKKYEHQVGKLYKGVQEAQFKNLTESEKTAFRNVLTAELEKMGVDDVNGTADILVKSMYDKKLTRAESQKIEAINGIDIVNKVWNSAEFTTEQENQVTENAEKVKENIFLPASYKGKTIIDATNEEVDSMVITSLEGDDITLNVKTGDKDQTVTASELKLNSDYEIVFEGLRNIKDEFGLDETTASNMLSLWEGYEGSAESFVRGIKSSFMYGQYNMRYDFDKSDVVQNLPERIRNQVYEMGRTYKQKVTDEREAYVKNNATTKATGKVTYAEGLHYEDLNEKQKAYVDYASLLAEILGYDLEIFRSPKDASGNSLGENGLYSMGKSKMRLDVDAGTINGESFLMFTLAHELDHYILDWSPAKHKIFADYLVETYGKKGVSVDELVRARIADSILASKKDKTGKRKVLSYEDAFNEVVGESCTEFFKDANLRQRILEIEGIDKGLAQKIKDFLKDIVAKLDKFLKRLKAESTEAKHVRGFDVDALEKLKNKWVDALKDSRENVLQARKMSNDTLAEAVKLQDRASSEQDSDRYFPIDLTKDNELSKLIGDKTGSEKYNTIRDYIWGLLGNESIVFSDGTSAIIDKSDALHIANKAYDQKTAEISVIKELIKSAVLFAEEYTEHKKFNYFKYYAVNVKYGNDEFPIYLNVGRGKNDGLFHLYDITKKIRDTANRINGFEGLREFPSINSISMDSISNPTENVNTGDENQTIAGIDYDALNSAKNENGKDLFQYRAIQHDVPEYRALLEKYSDMSKGQIDSLFNTMDKAFAIIEDNLEILDYAWDENLNEDGTWDDTIDARAFNPVKPNSDKLYKYSLDFSTLCRKRLLQQVIAEELSLALDRAVTKAEGIAIRNELIKLQEEGRQIEIACALCYVESARMKSPEQIQKFLNDAGQMVREFFATKAKSDIAEAEEKARKAVAKKYAKEIKEGAVGPTDTYTTKKGKVKYTPLSKLPKKMADEIRKAKGDARSSYSPSAEEQRVIDIASNLPVTAFTTAEGLKNLAKDNPVIFDAYTSFVRNATHSKGTEKDVWYRVGDANKIGDDLIAAMNKENGLRSQSWSDFQVIHLLDYVGAIIELSTKNAKMQSYTKVPDYVNLMGLTGQMINLSLIPSRDFNGKLEFDPVEGMVFKVARELRDKYPDTTGTISIGITNEQIQMLLESMDIDYVIPYHHSAMSKVVRKEMYIPSWVSYQEYQGEKKISSKKDALANAKKYGVQLLNANDENYHKAPIFSEWFDLDEARQVAQLENLNPTDPKAQKKYGVMYGGYKAMQNAADNYLRLCAERGLVPKFCHEKADFTTEENYWKLLIDRKMINQKTGEIIEQKPVQPIFNEGEVLNILNNEVARYEGVKEDFDYATRIVTEKFLNGEMNESISKIAKSIGDTVTNVTKVAILNSDVQGKTYLQDRDSTGRELTPEQVEFFKDSKVRDEEGNLRVMYHGTPNGEFNTFRISEGAHSSLMAQYGAGYYFDSNKDSAKRYTNNVNKTSGKRNPKVFEVYLNIKNPLEINDEYMGENKERVISKEQFFEVVNRGNYEWFFENGMPFDLQNYLGKSKSEIQQMPRVDIIGKWVDMVYDRAYFESEVLSAMVKAYRGDSILSVMKDVFGKDGVKVTDKYGEMWVSWDNTQIKNTDNLTPTESEDIRYQDRVTPEEDAAYMDAYYDGDDDLMQELVDKAANKLGYKYKAYHHTENGFTVFDLDKARKNMDIQGFFFSADKDAESEYGSVRYDTYLKMNNPYIVDSKEKAQAIPFNLGKENAGVIAREWLQSQGYDSVIRKAEYYGAEADEYIVFESSQIKSAEPMTFTDDEYGEGDVITLSKRFNESNEDIRYQDRVQYSNSVSAAVEKFGITNDIERAGFVVPNGRMLNLSQYGLKGVRHKLIEAVYDDVKGDDAINRFLQEGNVRIKADAPGIEIGESVVPTISQINTMKKFINTSLAKNDVFYLDITDKNGNEVASVTYYADDVDVSDILYDIERYYENGKIPKNHIMYQDRVYNGSLTQERIDDLIADSGAGKRVDYAREWIASINPSEFLDLTLEYETRKKGRDFFDAEVEGDHGSVMGDRDYLADLQNSNTIPVLYVNMETGKVGMHNGRHRMRALEKTGASKTPIRIVFYNDDEMYKGNNKGERLETIDVMRLTSQFDDKFYHQHKAYIHNIIPLNEDHREEIEKEYRAKPMDVKYGFSIAYQDRPISDREVLVDAMENIEELSTEDQNRLEIYKGKIDKINELEKDLADVGKQIHKIITTKGSDRKQLASLNAKSDALRKQISRLDGELLRIEAMKPMKNLVEIRKKQVLKAYKEKAQAQRKKNVEGRNKTATKNKIKRVVKTLESLYGNPTKEKNVKIEFQDMVKKALIMADAIFDSGNISSSDILSGNITTTLSEKDKKNLDAWRKVYEAKKDYQQKLDALESSEKVNPKTHDELLKMISECNKRLNVLSRNLSEVVERQRADLNDSSVQDAIGSLVDAYKSLNESTEAYAKAAYNDYVAKRLDALKESLKNTSIKTMTLTQLDEVYQAYKMVLTTVRTANELFVNNKKMSVAAMGESVIAEVQRVAKPTDNKIAGLKEIRNFSWENLKPIYAFERIGSRSLMQLFKEARKGEDVFARDISDATEFFRTKNKDYGFDSWDFKKRMDFRLSDGRTFSISLQEMMSIYAYSKREQALDHITKGGFVFDNKEFFKTKEKGLKGVINRERTTVEAYKLDVHSFNKIINALTKEQKQFVDDMQEYLSAVMGAKGNEVSRVLYGIDLFKEKYYFPLMSSNDFIQQTNQPVGEIALKNSGMAKATVPHAHNPIVLQGFMDVWTGHVNKMSTYHAFVLPIENLNKVYNYTGYARDNHSVSVKTMLKGVFGDGVNKYIENFITDLNGGIKVQSSGNLFVKGISLFKKTAVAASTSVVIQQPTAIVRALAMIDRKYFIHKPDGMKHNDAWEELKKYAPIAIVKEMGGFDISIGRQVGEYITAKEYKGKDKIKGFFTDSTYRDEAYMWGAEKADEIGWLTIWGAVKKEIADTTTYKVGSEEFLNACGERFTDIVTYTQVYDSVFSRSGFMRNKGEIAKMATAFKGEPTTSFNMLYNAVLQAKRKNIGGKEVAKTIGAVFSSVILAAIAKSFIYGLRDDDNDESYAEKYTQALVDSLKDELFVPNMLPFVSDITSLFEGWDVERTDMAILKDLKDAIDGLESDSKSYWRKVEDLAGAAAAFFGIPLKNIMRTVREGYNTFANILDDNVADEDDVKDSIFGKSTMADVNDLLDKGKTDKAKEEIDSIIADKVKDGKTEKEAKSSVKSSVTSYWKALYLQAYRDKDNAEMLRIRRILQATGLYDNVVESCSNWIKNMKDEEETEYTKW